jgi:hypothetical protein
MLERVDDEMESPLRRLCRLVAGMFFLRASGQEGEDRRDKPGHPAATPHQRLNMTQHSLQHVPAGVNRDSQDAEVRRV